MFDDPNKELKQLEEKLLAEETDQADWFEKELQEAKALIGETSRKPAPAQNPQIRNYANNYGKNTGNSKKNEKKVKQKGIKGLVVLAILETLGIVGLVAYWLMFLI